MNASKIKNKSILWLLFLSLFPLISTAENVPTIGKEGERNYYLGSPLSFNRNINWFGNHQSAYVLDRGQMETSLSYQTVNQSLDIFGIRKKRKKDSLSFLDLSGSVGDLNAWEFTYNFGLADRVSLLSQAKQSQLEYGVGTVTLEHLMLGFRWEWLRERTGPQIALQLTGHSQRGSGFEDQFSSISLRDIETTETSQLSSNTTVIRFEKPQKIQFGGLKSEEGRGDLLISKQFAYSLYGHAFFGYRKVHLSSELDFSLGNFRDLKKLVTRDEESRELGLGFDLRLTPNWSLYSAIQMLTVQRYPSVAQAATSNQMAQVEAMLRLNSNWALTLQGRYFSKFFVAEVPFLLNEKTAGVFENPYGYMGLGILYSFDYSRFLHPFFVNPN